MNRGWLKIIIGAVFEVGWVVGLKHAFDFWTWFATVIAIIVSFYLLIDAGGDLPVGTAYAVFVGLGTAGTVLCEIIFFGVSFELIKIVFIVVLLTGVIGLKLLEENVPEGESS